MSTGSCMIWTQRMLQALERGNDGRKWHTLIDKVYAPVNLRSALCTVTQRKTSPGIDGRSATSVAKDAEAEVATLERLLREGKYEPQPVKRVWIPKPGSRDKRPLGIPTIRGRIVETALRDVIEPIFEHSFAEHSYGFRPKRSAKQAVARVEGLLHEGRHWVVDADIKGYFDNIPHAQLMDRVSDKISDSRVLGLIEKMLKQGVMETMNDWIPTDQGTPQGAVISPLLANIYLDPFDHQMAAQGREMIRYADDFVILCKTQTEAEEALEQVRAWMSKAGLTLHPEKTRIVDATQRGGFEFLGWHFDTVSPKIDGWIRGRLAAGGPAAPDPETLRDESALGFALEGGAAQTNAVPTPMPTTRRRSGLTSPAGLPLSLAGMWALPKQGVTFFW
jgi:RNA-directed DNA polymerase